MRYLVIILLSAASMFGLSFWQESAGFSDVVKWTMQSLFILVFVISINFVEYLIEKKEEATCQKQK